MRLNTVAQQFPTRQAGVITDLVLLWTVGIRPVLVHGGGPEINSWLTKLGITPEFKKGLRITDGASPPSTGRALGTGAVAWQMGGGGRAALRRGSRRSA